MKQQSMFVIRLLIGALFIVSGFSKSLDSQAFAQLMQSYGLGRFQTVAPFIAFAEVLFGLLLILNYRKQLIATLIGAMTIAFTVAFFYAYNFRGVTDCGCMGFLTQTPAWLSFTRNLLVIAGCAWIGLSFTDKKSKFSLWKQWVLIVVSFSTFGLASYTYGKSIFPSYKLSIGDSIEKSFIGHYKGYFPNNNQYGFLFIFSPDCNHCWNSTANINTIRQSPELGNVLGLTFDVTDTTDYMKSLKPQFPVVMGSTDSITADIKRIPVLVVIKNGKISRIFAKEIPCAAILKRELELK
jgi:uncharacterized membrane protein YphA (DoxX/SURF4 family)